jgi:hypothetical protein
MVGGKGKKGEGGFSFKDLAINRPSLYGIPSRKLKVKK